MSNPPASTNDSGWDSDGGQLLDDFCEWYGSLDEISELPVPRPIHEAHAMFETWTSQSSAQDIREDMYVCQCVRIFDENSRRHIWISRALASKSRDLEVQYLASPPIVLDTWDRTQDDPVPEWLCYPRSTVVSRLSPSWNIIPLYTVFAFDPENAAKKLAIHRWCSGVEPALYAWAYRASLPTTSQ
ncbi:hypothetical protein BJ138DRAFT_1106810 [Hygrophoropsis aurantiaca]|uniref:Uncharacterized protein n=1 Tax=Hygrophoropsis aurantiaca TaxID=72124 RepID=A0ACB7ZUU7_9AGAM|nr:hypothetical protein BJ138DRAFT_1106810 [Hygrophoropsis aurantiaca]